MNLNTMTHKRISRGALCYITRPQSISHTTPTESIEFHGIPTQRLTRDHWNTNVCVRRTATCQRLTPFYLLAVSRAVWKANKKAIPIKRERESEREKKKVFKSRYKHRGLKRRAGFLGGLEHKHTALYFESVQLLPAKPCALSLSISLSFLLSPAALQSLPCFFSPSPSLFFFLTSLSSEISLSQRRFRCIITSGIVEGQ